MSFEDMMAKYLEESEETLKMLDKRAKDKVGNKKCKLDRTREWE